MENWPVRKKKKRYRGLILALLMLVPAGYIGVQMVQVLRTNYQTQTAVAYSMSDVVRCDGMLAMDETVIPYEGAGVLGYQVNNGERVSAGTQVARLFADEASAQNRTLSEKLTEELSVLEKSQAGAAADVEALMNQNQQGIYSALDLLESGNYTGLSDARASIQLAQNKMQLDGGRIGFQRPHCGPDGAARRGGCRQRIHTDNSSGGRIFCLRAGQREADVYA